MKKIFNYVKGSFHELKVLLRSAPSLLVGLFFVSVVGMNLLANKSINTGVDWLALDAGILLSWMIFMCMDIITKRYGPKAANMISIMGLLVNLLMALIFFLVSIIPGVWSASYVEGSENIINHAFDGTFAGTWFIILGSSIAFIVSAFINNFLNYLIGKSIKKNPNGFLAFALRSYVSTFIGQFIDNFLFALIVSLHFFGWSILQCVTCALTGAVLELLFEIIFSPLGYKICRSLEKDNQEDAYLKLIAAKKEELTHESVN